MPVLISDAVVVRAERLRDDMESFLGRLRKDYKAASLISNKDVQRDAQRLAEAWLTEIIVAPGVRDALEPGVMSEITVQVQRLLGCSERAASRKDYTTALTSVLDEFKGRVVVPLKQRRKSGGGHSNAMEETRSRASVSEIKSIFVGHSFTSEDGVVVDALNRLFAAFGVEVVTGEKPSARSVSRKVQQRIESSDAFLGIFGRREKLAKAKGWTTSSWVVDEKAFALAKGKKLILLKEEGVTSIGGIQGDYEYLEFSRADLLPTFLGLVELLLEDAPQ